MTGGNRFDFLVIKNFSVSVSANVLIMIAFINNLFTNVDVVLKFSINHVIIYKWSNIMDVETLQFYAQYNSDVNRNMDSLIMQLSEDQWNQQFSGYFNSVRSLCNHIYTCDFNWLMRFSLFREFNYPTDTEIPNGLEFGKMQIGNTQDYLNKRVWLDKKIIEFTKELNEDDLKQDLRYTDSHGIIYERNYGRLILHMFNHETHHRGMISIYLEEMKIENDFSNIYDYI